MNAITLYGIYETTRKNHAPDTTIGLAMFKAEHPEVKITQEEDKAMREFMGQHGQELAAAFPDRDAFAAAVAAGMAEDAKKAELAAELVAE
ncbi:MAG: hypothetical protein VB071_05030 [Lawsonibacter sp.]|nr:hypothetical protein [Lawsonibacter sp.]